MAEEDVRITAPDPRLEVVADLLDKLVTRFSWVPNGHYMAKEVLVAVDALEPPLYANALAALQRGELAPVPRKPTRRPESAYEVDALEPPAQAHRHANPSPSHCIAAWCNGTSGDLGCGEIVPLYAFHDLRRQSYFIDSRDAAEVFAAARKLGAEVVESSPLPD